MLVVVVIGWGFLLTANFYQIKRRLIGIEKDILALNAKQKNFIKVKREREDLVETNKSIKLLMEKKAVSLWLQKDKNNLTARKIADSR